MTVDSTEKTTAGATGDLTAARMVVPTAVRWVAMMAARMADQMVGKTGRLTAASTVKPMAGPTESQMASQRVGRRAGMSLDTTVKPSAAKTAVPMVAVWAVSLALRTAGRLAVSRAVEKESRLV